MINLTKANVEVWNLIHSKRPKAKNSRCRSSSKTPSSMLDTLKVLGSIGPLKAMVDCKAIVVEREKYICQSASVREIAQSLRFFQGLGVREREWWWCLWERVVLLVFVREREQWYSTIGVWEGEKGILNLSEKIKMGFWISMVCIC